jgi:hypothetical protein
VLSSVTPNPGARFVDLAPAFTAMLAQLGAAGVDTRQVGMAEGALLFGDTTSFVKARVSPDSVAQALAKSFRAIAGVNRVDFLTTLAASDTTSDDIGRRWLHMFSPGGAVRFVTTLDRFNYYSGVKIAMHGSPWDQDAWVPVIFWGAPFAPGKYSDRVRVVDMAPTLADVLRIRPLEQLDGVVLSRATRH